MTENYDLIFGQSASQQYGWSDSDYQNGWQTVGSTPPTAEQFDALQRRSDTKAKDLNDRLSPLETTASKALARVTPAANRLPYFNSSNSATTTAISDFTKTLLDDKDAATARATLGAPSTTGANASGSWNINAATATKLATARKIELTGNVTGSANFDGSKDIQIATSLANVSALAHSLLSKTTAADMRDVMDIKISSLGGQTPITAVIGDYAMAFGHSVIPGSKTELTVQLPFNIGAWGRKVLLTQYGYGNYATLMYKDGLSSDTNIVVQSSTSSPDGIYFYWLVAGRKG